MQPEEFFKLPKLLAFCGRCVSLLERNSQKQLNREIFFKPPLTDLPIKTADGGFYGGFSVNVTVVSKIIISVLVV